MIAFYILEWYVLILIISSLSFIITFDIFKNLNDKGYCISKVIGISILSFFSLILSLFSPLSMHFNIISYLSLTLITLYAIFRIIKTHKTEGLKEIYKFIDQRYKLIILIESAFLLIITFGSYVRAFFPDLLALHKINELGYVRSIINSTTLFPENLWLSGYTLGKNFFGYYILSNLISLYPQKMEVAFNIIPSTILAILVIVSGSIVYNVTSKKSYGILAGFLTIFIGNYEALNIILKEGLVNEFNWWTSGNFFSDKIFTEFPLWSALFGDIEPYFISLPFIASILILIYLAVKENMFIVNNKITSKSLYLSGIIIIISYFCWIINLYSSIILIILALTLLGFVCAKFYKEKQKLKLYLVLFTTIFTISIIPSVFFLGYLHNDIAVIFTNTTPLNSFDLFKLLGVVLLPVTILTLIQFKKLTKISIKECVFITIIFLSIIEFAGVIKFINIPFLTVLFGILFIAMVGLSVLKIKEIANTSDKIAFYIIFSLVVALLLLLALLISNTLVLTSILILISAALLLIEKDNNDSVITSFLLISLSLSLIVTNFLSFDDDSSVNNTVISYLITQIIFIFPLILVFVIHKTCSMLISTHKEIYITILSVILFPALLFAIFGPYYMAHKFKPIESLIPNLSGSNHITVFHGGDYSAIEWIKTNIKPGQVVLEAIKDNLTYSGRISAYSGSATILQRPDYQLFMYGDKMEPVLKQRKSDLDLIYKELDKQKIVPLLKKYNIEYVYIGEIEKSMYPIKSLKAFSNIATVAYNTGESVIYQLNWCAVN